MLQILINWSFWEICKFKTNRSSVILFLYLEHVHFLKCLRIYFQIRNKGKKEGRRKTVKWDWEEFLSEIMLLLYFASSRRKCSCLSTPSLYLPSLESVVGGDNKRIGGISIRVKCPELTHFNISLGKYFTNKIYFILKFKGFGGGAILIL